MLTFRSWAQGHSISDLTHRHESEKIESMKKMLIKFLGHGFSNLNIINSLLLENLALRQQLAILHRRSKKSRLNARDRLFWVAISRFWKGWKNTLIIVNPDTVIKTTFKIKEQEDKLGM